MGYQSCLGGILGFGTALAFGTVAGAIVAAAGDVLQARIRNVEELLKGAHDSDSHSTVNTTKTTTTTTKTTRRVGMSGSWDKETTTTTVSRVFSKEPLGGSMLVVSLYAHGVMGIIYENCADIILACFLASMGGLCIVALARIIQVWEPTRRIGEIMEKRVTRTRENWTRFPLRSSMESSLWFGIVLGTYQLRGDFLTSIQVGSLAIIPICMSSDFLMGIRVKATTETVINDGKLSNLSCVSGTKVATGRTAARPARSRERRWTADEISKHNKVGDAWIIIDGGVYDVSSWALRHPGGVEIILSLAGGDASDQFAAFHLPRVYRQLRPFQIGLVSKEVQDRNQSATNDYRALRRKLLEGGYFDVSMTFFIGKGIL